jgi:hypothetical protein
VPIDTNAAYGMTNPGAIEAPSLRRT